MDKKESKRYNTFRNLGTEIYEDFSNQTVCSL